MDQKLLFAGAALALTTALAAPSRAQESSPEVEADVEVDTQSADVGDTVVVTARRRSESIQNVPIAVSVIDSGKIDSTGSFNVGRLQQLAPALTYYSSNPRNTAVNIRGIGAPFGLTNDGIEQGVGIYVDDVYYSRIASATFDFLDVDRIEVLHGPQGTLYGKNTTAGAINITTRQPTFDLEGRAEVSLGNLDFKQLKAAISGPLSETVAARLALSATGRRGTIYNVTTQRWINAQDNIGLRGQLLWRPNDDLSITFSGDFSTQDPECCGTVFVGTGSTQRPIERQFAALAAAQDYAVPSTNPYDRLTDVDARLSAGNRIGGASARLIWDVGGGTLTSVTAWRFWDWEPENDRDYTGLPVVTRSQNPSRQDQYTQEFRFAKSGDRIDFVLGAFGYYQRIDTQGTESHGSASSQWSLSPSSPLSADPSVLDGLTAINTQWLKNLSAALYGQLSWKVTDTLSIQPGARLNYDWKSGYYERRVFDGQGNPVLFGQTDPVKVAQRSIFAPQLVEPTFSSWNFSYDLTVSFRPTSTVMAYATYSKSFKSGGINLNGMPADANGAPILAAGTVRPESVNHWEAGLKSQWWGRKVTANIAAFRTEIDDYQANVTNGQFGVLRGYLANADKVRTQGAEVELSVRPSRRFNAYVSGTYTDARYVRFTDAPCPPELSGGPAAGSGPAGAPGLPGGASPANCDISGQVLPGVSRWSFSYGAEANVPLEIIGPDGEAYLGIDGSTRSRFSSSPSPSAYGWIEGYTLTNLRAGVRTGSLDLFLWARNVFDVEYLEQLSFGPGNSGLIVGQPGDPRTWGATAKIVF